MLGSSLTAQRIEAASALGNSSGMGVTPGENISVDSLAVRSQKRHTVDPRDLENQIA